MEVEVEIWWMGGEESGRGVYKGLVSVGEQRDRFQILNTPAELWSAAFVFLVQS